MRRRPSKESGFTLAEAAIGLFLISLALLTLMSEFTYTGRSVILGRQRTGATYLAQVMLDRLTNEALVELGQYNGVDTRSISTLPTAGTTARGAVDNWANLLTLQLKEGAYGVISVESPVNVETDTTKPERWVDGLTRIEVRVFWPTTRSRFSDVRLFLIRRS